MEIQKTKVILQDDNFLTWKYEITMILTQRRIAKVIKYYSFANYLEGNDLELEEAKKKSKRVKWQEDDEAAKGFIGLSVDPKYYSTVQKANTSYEVMGELEKLFEGKNNAKRFKLKDDFHNSKQKKYESLTNYLDRIKLINDDLISLDDDGYNEYDLSVKIISTLLDNYEPVKMSCLMIPKEELNLNFLRQRFAMDSSNSNQRNNGVSVNNINHNNNNNNNNNACYKCGMTNHKAKFCKSPQWKIDKYRNNGNNNNNNDNNDYNNKTNQFQGQQQNRKNGNNNNNNNNRNNNNNNNEEEE
jgi:hypothetical protein